LFDTIEVNKVCVAAEIVELRVPPEVTTLFKNSFASVVPEAGMVADGVGVVVIVGLTNGVPVAVGVFVGVPVGGGVPLAVGVGVGCAVTLGVGVLLGVIEGVG
jgi:hypothetical protein